MNTTDLIHHYGYLAIVIGAFFEGETIVLAAGVAAGAGFLNLPGVMVAGMVGIFANDTLRFLLGRLAGRHLASWFPRIHQRLSSTFDLIRRYQEGLIICFQFIPGLGAVTPVAFGMTDLSIGRFIALDLIGNIFGTAAYSLGGYLAGATLVYAFDHLPLWIPAAGLIASVSALGWVLLHWTPITEAMGRQPERNQGF